MAGLLKAVHEFAESAAQEPAGTGAAEALAQLAEKAADATLPGTCAGTLSDAAKYFGDLVPVLIARDREQAQKGRHGWESAAYCVAPLLIVPTRTPRENAVSSISSMPRL